MGTNHQLPHSTITGSFGNGKPSRQSARHLNAKLVHGVASADSPRPAARYGSTLAGARTHDVFRFRKAGFESDEACVPHGRILA